MRSIALTLCLAATAIAVAGCGLLTTEAATGVSPALLVAGEDTATITAPDTVDHGVNFTVTVGTLGGGCTREAARTEYASDSQFLEVHPFDKWSAVNCPNDAIFIPHQLTVKIDAAGARTLRIVGREAVAGTNTTVYVELDKPLYVR
jgi:hypothetical protein